MAASFVPLAIAQATAPSFNRAWSSDRKEAEEVYNAAERMIFLLSVVVCIMVVLLGKTAIWILYGREFLVSATSLHILAISLIFMPLNRYYGYILVAVNKQSKVAKYTGIGAAFNLLTNMIFVRTGGIIAVSITTLMTEMLVTLSERIEVKKNIRII